MAARLRRRRSESDDIPRTERFGCFGNRL